MNTSEVGTLPFCSGFEPLAACLLLFVRLHVKMNRNIQKTNSHSWGHVKGEWQPLVYPHATIPPNPPLAGQSRFGMLLCHHGNIYLVDVYLVCVGMAIRHFVKLINGLGALVGSLTIETSA